MRYVIYIDSIYAVLLTANGRNGTATSPSTHQPCPTLPTALAPSNRSSRSGHVTSAMGARIPFTRTSYSLRMSTSSVPSPALP